MNFSHFFSRIKKLPDLDKYLELLSYVQKRSIAVIQRLSFSFILPLMNTKATSHPSDSYPKSSFKRNETYWEGVVRENIIIIAKPSSSSITGSKNSYRASVSTLGVDEIPNVKWKVNHEIPNKLLPMFHLPFHIQSVGLQKISLFR